MEKLNKYDYNKKIEKLEKKETEKEKLKLLYSWVKTKVICFSDFEALIFYCT
tara:strand:+ start:1985 stop:2140 length:156 start_codon:yes stop_codon:yes gene_type:complete